MKKQYSLLGLILCIPFLAFSQLSGTKTIPGSYPSIASAIADLNSQGVGAGGVTFDIAAGYSETFTSSTDGLITTTTGSSIKPIVFRKSGTGSNPVIYPAYGQGYYDYILCIAGTDYLTIDGIDLIESPLNTDTDTQAEYGILFAKAEADSSGTQFCTIRNCMISLTRSNVNTVGIILRNWLGINPGYMLPSVNNSRKANSNNSIQGNIVKNCFTGIYMYGSAAVAPYETYDLYNDIGSVAGNTITNFGHNSGSCYGIYAQYENFLTIANNTISGNVPGGYCYGIELQVTANASLDLYNNTISIQYDGTGTFYGIRDYFGNTATNSNVVNIHHNTVTGCTAPNSNSIVSYMELGHGGPNTNIYNNVITNNQYGSPSKVSNAEVHYLYIGYYPTTLGVANIYDNQVTDNIRYQSPAGTGGITRYMRFGPQCQTLNVYGNLCDNNTSSITGTVYGIDCPSLTPVTKNIYNNSFTNLYQANGTTYCFSINDGYSWNIYRNRIVNIEGQGTSTVITGMYLGFTGGSGNVFVSNNMIGNLKAGMSGSTSAITGITAYIGPLSVKTGFYNNTVLIKAGSAGANFGTAGLYISKFIKAADLRNNIIVNTSTPNGTGKTVVLLTDSLNFGNLAMTSNNNNYYAGVPSSQNLIFTDGSTSSQTLLQYRSRFFPREYNSISENPPFISPNHPLDLHLNPAVATQCESGGVAVLNPVVIGDDFDGDPRYPNAGYPVNPLYPPASCDIGADEFAGIPDDQKAPFISYAPFANTAITGDRMLTATITDAHGVPTTGTGLPRLCWKINTGGTWTYVTGTHIAAGKYQFSFGGGTALNDTVYYFIVAQDSWGTPNVGAVPLSGAGGYSANPPAASVVPANPDKYVIVQPICGTFTVGSGGNYATLTAAITDINNKGLTCPVTLILTDNAYNSETYPISLNPNGGSSSVNTLTIRPASGKLPVFAGVSNASGIIRIDGFDYLTIDGSATGGTDKGITFYNASETNGAYTLGFFNKDMIKPATNITVKNCIIRARNTYTVTNYGIYGSPEGGGYENIVITGDSIYGGHTGILFTGNFNGVNQNNQFTNNVIGSTSEVKYVADKGIVLQYCDNTLISGNNIMGPVTGNNLPLQAGIHLQSGSTATKIHGNLIHDFYRNADDGSGAFGILYEGESHTVTEIINNVIYGIKSSGAAPGPSPNNCYGIYILSGGNIRILHNTIYLYGNVLSPSNMHDASSACLGIYRDGSITNNLEVRNNIMKNSQQGLYGGCPATGRAYGIMTMSTNPSNFSILDNNDYYIDGCNGKIGLMNYTGYGTMPDWQAVTGQELHSLQVDPVFVSPSLLIPTSALMNKAGAYIATVPADITGLLRTNPPDMGAYEFAYGMSAQTNNATGISNGNATLNGTLSPNMQTCWVWFDYGTTTAYGSTIAGNPVTVSGINSVSASAVITGLAAGTYHFRVRMVSLNNITVYGQDKTFPTIPDTLTVTGTAGGGSVSCHDALSVILVAGNGTTFAVESGSSATFIAGQKIRFLPGTIVHAGGYMNGYISTNGQFCNAMDNMVAVQPSETDVPMFFSPVHEKNQTVKIYPNPTSGEFYLSLSNFPESEKVSVQIINLTGSKMLDKFVSSNEIHRFSIMEMPVGIYFIKVTGGSTTNIEKLIKI